MLNLFTIGINLIENILPKLTIIDHISKFILIHLILINNKNR